MLRPAPPRRGVVARRAATLALLVALASVDPSGGARGGVAPAAADTGPPTVAPGEDDGAEVTLRPAVARPEGTTRVPLTVTIGRDAAGDVVVRWAVHEVTVSPDGVVTPGDRVPPDVAVAGRGARAAPGEALTTVVELRAATSPLLVVATVTAATDPTDDAPTVPPVEVVSLLLPGDPPGSPAVALVRRDGQLTATVTVEAPTLVSARLVGATTTETVDRLVLPDRPWQLRAAAAPWPRPSALVVVDEAARTQVLRTGTRDLVVVTAVLVVVAAGASGLLLRRRRGRTVSR